MNNYDLLDAVGGIAPEYVEGAKAPARAKRPVWRTALPIAACVCLAAGALVGLKLAGVFNKSDDPKTVMNTGDAPAVTETDAEPTEEEAIVTAEPAAPADPTEMSGGISILPEQGSWSFLTDNAAGEMPELVTVISSYPGEKNDEHPVVGAGQVAPSPALHNALNAYGAVDENGNKIVYRVTVELFEGVCCLTPSTGPEPFAGLEAEAHRLFDEAGIICVLGCFTDENKNESTWSFGMHITANQLANFPVSDTYGYYIMLYGETFGDYSEPGEPIAFSGANGGFGG